MRQDRREFMKTLGWGAGGMMIASCATVKSCQTQIANRPMRRNFATLPANDPIIEAYRLAIKEMKRLPTTDRRNWTRQAEIHNNFCPHGNWLFLPWHRVYLLYFERICRKLSGMEDFALPYWNWSTTPTMPAAFRVNDSSNELFNATRSSNASQPASSANVGASVLTSILNEPNFETFGSGAINATVNPHAAPRDYGRLEATPHNYIHGHISGDMGGFMSPLDPIFWLHHNMIERCWVKWNFDQNHPNTEDRAWLDREFNEFCDENGNPVRITVAMSLLFPVFSYRYDDAGTGAAGAQETQASQAVAERKAKSGARIKLNVQKRFPAPQPVAVALDRPVTVRIATEPQVLRAAERKLLRFEDVSLDHTEDFSVRVFINKPDATAETPVEDPHFAGAFAFFQHAMPGHDHGGGNFVLDVDDVLKRLNIAGGTLDVALVLVPFSGRQPRTRTLTIKAAELRIAKDEIERAQ